jgi:penicillin-binding protein 2
MARIQEVIFKYPAFSIVTRPQRRYEVSTSGNLLGYTNEVNERDIKKIRPTIFRVTLLEKQVLKKHTKKTSEELRALTIFKKIFVYGILDPIKTVNWTKKWSQVKTSPLP